jgi:hypothetical protein
VSNLIYLATPYSRYPDGLSKRDDIAAGGLRRERALRKLHEAFTLASENAALLISAGLPIYSPIAHTHPIAIYGGLDPLDLDIWLPFCKPFMDACKGAIYLQGESVEHSAGMSWEGSDFQKAGKPGIDMKPYRVTPELIAWAKSVLAS